MTGADLRKRRLALALTQNDLARLVDRTQATISGLEARDGDLPSLILNRLEDVLTHLEQERPSGSAVREPGSSRSLPVFDLPAVPTIDPPARDFLLATAWRRPRLSGDRGCVIALPDGSALVAVIDVAGQGLSAFPSALYVEAWLRGRLAREDASPRLPVLARDLSDELRAVGLEIGCFMAVVARHRQPWPAVSYEGVAYGFPPPLLIAGPPFRTLESAHLAQPLPTRGDEPVVRVDSLAGPWRLVVATDGLLQRLGEGSEENGLRVLRRWQSGPDRNLESPPQLTRGGPETDDELLLTVRSNLWRDEVAFAAADCETRNRMLRRIRQDLEEVAGQDAADRFTQAVLEAADNAAEHAYGGSDGVVRVRRLMDDRHMWVEVEDEGYDGLSPSVVERANGGLAIMNSRAKVVDVRNRPAGGTVVTLVAEHTPVTRRGAR